MRYLNCDLARHGIDGDLDFFAYASSFWTALGVDAAILKATQRENRRPRGIIRIRPTGKGEFIISPADFVCVDFADVSFQYDTPSTLSMNFSARLMRKLQRAVRYLATAWLASHPKTKARTVYIISPLQPDLRVLLDLDNIGICENVRPVFVVIDEGFLSYGSGRNRSLTSLYSTKRDNTCVSNAIRLVTRTLHSLPMRIIRHVAIRNENLENRFLFSRLNGLLKVNDDVAQAYQTVLEIRHRPVSKPLTKSDQRLAVVMTQPFLQYLAEDDVNQLLIRIIRILQSLRFEVAIKPHPRDDIRTYRPLCRDSSVSFIDAGEPMESVLARETIGIVIGFTSTALLNAKVLFGIRAISFAESLIGLTKHSFVVTNCREFMSLTRDYVEFAANPDDLPSILGEASMTHRYLDETHV